MENKSMEEDVPSKKRTIDPIDRQTNFSFFLKDFEKIFDMYMQSHRERSESVKMFVTMATAPFIIISILGIAGDVDMTKKSLIEMADQFPSFMFFIFSIFGIAGIIPFHRFLAAHQNQYKMTRYMNNYRLFYYQLIKDELDYYKWWSPIEKDPRYPLPRFVQMHWVPVAALGICVINTVYLSVGLFFWDGNDSGLLIGVLADVMVIVHFVIAKLEINDRRDTKDLEKSNMPIDEIIKIVDNKNREDK